MAKVIEDEDPDLLVADAEAAALEAQALVTAIEDRIMAGDESVSHEDLSKQISVARFASKFVEGARAKAAQIREDRAARARAALAAEVLRDAPEDGKELLAIVDRLIADSAAFMEKTDAHSAKVRGWVNRALELGVPDKGVPSEEHAGLGVSGSGDILVGDVRVTTVSGRNVLALLFHPVDGSGYFSGILPATDPDRIDAARGVVGNIGKAAV